MNKWGLIQFHHHPEGYRAKRYTAAIEVLEGTFFARLFADMVNGVKPEPLKMRVGIAVCHPKDNYDHRIGRETSAARLKEVEFEVRTCQFVKPGKIELTMEAKLEKTLIIAIHLRTDQVATPRLIDAYGDFSGGE